MPQTRKAGDATFTYDAGPVPTVTSFAEHVMVQAGACRGGALL
jgi:hypothetical protein